MDLQNKKIEHLKTFFNKEFINQYEYAFIPPNIDRYYWTDYSMISMIYQLYYLHKLVFMLINNGNSFYVKNIPCNVIFLIMKKYIELYPDDCNIVDKKERTPLMIICYYKNKLVKNICDILNLFFSANLDLQDKYNRTALMCLFEFDKNYITIEMIKYFKNSNLNLKDINGYSIIHIICKNGLAQFLEYLLI